MPTKLTPPEGFALNHQQLAAVTHSGGHCLVLAGAGTGKTRTIVGRAATLIRAGVPPERLLVLAFTRRAGSELRDRLRALCGDAGRRVTAGTFHSYCLRTMRQSPAAFGLDAVNVLDRADAAELWRLCRAARVAETGIFLPGSDEIAGWYGYARNADRPLEQYLKALMKDADRSLLVTVSRVIADYEERKRLRHYIDFDDILVRFTERIVADEGLRARVAARYDEILVDEFQDTNPVQWRLLAALCRGEPEPGRPRTGLAAGRDPGAHPQRWPRLYAVGDDAQSIFAFRGADFANVHSFDSRLPGATVMRLHRNYRSHQEILDVANWLLAHSPLSYGKGLVAQRGSAGTGAWGRPRLRSFQLHVTESDSIARDLVARHDECGAPWHDHLVLVRTASVAEDIEVAFIKHRVPYRLVGGVSLLASAHVKDVLALLRASVSHRDELAWSRYVRLFPRIGDATALRVVDAMGPADDWDVAIELGRQATRASALFALASRVRAQRESPGDAVRTAITSLTPLLERQYENWPKRADDLEVLARLAADHHAVEAFLDAFTIDPTISETLDAADAPDVVTLSTVHGAKGAEARVVFVAGADGGSYPHPRSRHDQAAVEEERRILYVALTRAQDELIITRVDRSGPGDGWPSAAMHEAYLLGGLPGHLVIEDRIGYDGEVLSAFPAPPAGAGEAVRADLRVWLGLG